MFPREFTPKLFTLFKEGFSKEQIHNDIFAGIIVGIIALPLAIAFAIASGVSPEKGIITAIIAGFIISFLGGSRVQIGGPTGAFIVVVAGIVSTHGLKGLITATFLAGFILILLGLFKFGDILKYISHSLISGFTTGIGLIIFSTQIKELLGLNIESNPHFLILWSNILSNLNNTNFLALAIGIATIVFIIVTNKSNSKIPSMLIAMAVMSALVHYFNIPVETINSKFGEISTMLPRLHSIVPSIGLIKTLLLPALSIALLGALESLLSAVVADGMIGGKHRSNQELVAQGIANIFSALFGGMPATGAIARTAANIKNGGRTPLAGIVHALTLLIILLIAAPLAKLIPLSCLAGILIYVAWNMSCLPEFISILKINIHERIVLLVTFFLTVFADLSLAILAGFIVSLLVLMKRMSTALEIAPILNTKQKDTIFKQEIGKIPDGILLFEINGPLFFGSVSEFIKVENLIHNTYKVFIIRMRYVPIIDITALKRLEKISHTLRKNKIKLLISGANKNIKKKLISFKIVEKEYIYENIKEALLEAKIIIKKASLKKGKTTAL